MSSTPTRNDDSAQVLVDAHLSTSRYFMRKTSRDLEHFGVSEQHYTAQALAESLVTPMNADLFAGRAPSLTGLVAAARRGPAVFHFLWRNGGTEVYAAVHECFFARPFLLKLRLLWLELPEQVPVSPRLGPKNGYQPLKEAVFAVLSVREDGRLEAPPLPR